MKRALGYLFLSVFFSFCILFATGQTIQRVEPTHWWVGLQNSKLQLIVQGKGIGNTEVKLTKKGVNLLGVHQVDNPDFLFLDIEILSDAKPGIYPIDFYRNKKKLTTYEYTIKSRENNSIKAQGVNSSDLIYLIMPDRFANGDPNNDIITGMREVDLNRDSMYYRHGGDIQGAIQRLDYLNDLGITSVWLTPVLTNNMPKASYHGYANTENYQIDSRLGTIEDYKKLGQELHNRDMKLVHDVVPNHVGEYHWTVVNKPTSDWVHEWPTYTQTSYKDQTIFDPYASKVDKAIMEKGWFVPSMPDLNHQNPFVQNYITQSHIWWIEEVGIDAFRIDTYPYNDLVFMSKWTDSILKEYPSFTFFGETWVHSVPNQAFFVGGQHVGQKVDSKLMGVTDFQLHYAIADALNKKMEWTEGVNKLYSVLASDYQYSAPERNVIFLDNHDKDRFFSVVGEDVQKYKSALAWLMTTRGIPQLYYGAEIMMKNFSNPDGLVREDFKGGFVGDAINKFEPKGRTQAEQDLWLYVRNLAQYRKANQVLQTGKTMQFVPEDGVYVYFRYDDHKTVMVIMNSNEMESDVNLDRFYERTVGFSTYWDIIYDRALDVPENRIKLKAKETKVIELRKK